MHPLLARQLKRTLNLSANDLRSLPEKWQQFVKVVGEAYAADAADRELIERSMELASQELGERNATLLEKNKELQQAQEQLRSWNEDLERRVAERTGALRHAMEQAEAANRAKSAFLANMSHEIRTPMTAILGYADMLLSPQLESRAQQIECIQTIRQQGEHLLAILNDILDLSKIEANKLSIERISASPCQIVSEAVSLMRVRAIEKKLTLEVSYLGPVPQTINTDPTRLRQILLNVIGNAIKFTEKGGVHVVVNFEDGKPVAAGDGSNVGEPTLCVDVVDSGIGMTDEQAKNLFKPFVQSDNSMTRRYGGTGLGLSICKRLAQMLGGDITVRSRAGFGSRFMLRISVGDVSQETMIFPVREAVGGLIATTAQAASQPSAPAETPLTSGELPSSSNTSTGPGTAVGGRVLVVDDGLHNQRVFRYYLEAERFTVTVTDNGRSACDLALEADASGKRFDVILMDMQMPHMDGYTAASLLRDKGCRTPIIAVTAHAMSGDREKCLAAGCTEYLSKPIDQRDLIKTVRAQLAPAQTTTDKTTTTATVPPAAQATDRAAEKPGADESSIRSTIDDPGLAQFLPSFIEELPRLVNQLRVFTEAGEVDHLAPVLHTLSGTAGMYGFPQISELARAAQRKLVEMGTVEAVADEVRELVRLLCRVEGVDRTKLVA